MEGFELSKSLGVRESTKQALLVFQINLRIYRRLIINREFTKKYYDGPKSEECLGNDGAG